MRGSCTESTTLRDKMVFSSLEFVFIFLPIAFIGDRLLSWNIKARNVFLFLISVAFYAWGEPKLVILFLSTIFVNYVSAIFLERVGNWIGTVAIIIDVGILFLFKYYDWICNGLNDVGGFQIPLLQTGLPIGISFYTFQAISYVADVMEGKVKAQRNPVNIGLYIAFFPQLIAGPIVRYTDMEKQIISRKTDFKGFSNGTIRFLTGFSKKVLLADSMGIVVDKAFLLLSEGKLGMPFAWLGAMCYTFQIFLDFSAYSDMAIGLGEMFGFKIPENFNKPYTAVSIRDFWRRWHISLSVWFRDYVYIPLGGNRGTSLRTYLNIAIVWFLTGLWHGANKTFLMWGGAYGILVMAEKSFRVEDKLKGGLISKCYRALTMFCVIILWVIFRAENIWTAFAYIGQMISFKDISVGWHGFVMYFFEMKLELAACVAFSFVVLTENIEHSSIHKRIRAVIVFAAFFISISYLVKGNYSPFLYFNF